MKEIYQYITKKSLFTDHKKVVVAVSGGLDSMTLLSFCYQYQKELGIELVIAHVNHHQRPESKQEEAYLRNLADQLNIPIYVGHFEGVFSEQAARDFRYDFFRRTMEQTASTALLTAHHENDQSETIFMRLIRGSRWRHISSIKEVQSFGPGQLIRPFLHLNPTSFPAVFHFEDSSNKDLSYFRNRVRHQWLPRLTEENPNIYENLRKLGNELQEANQALRELTKHLDSTDLTVFHSYSSSVQTILLEQYLEEFPDLAVSRKQFEEIMHILRTKANYCFPLNHAYELYKDYQVFRIQKIRPKTDEVKKSYVLEYGNLLEVPGYIISYGIPLEDPDQMIYFPSRENVVIRSRFNGDYISVNGHTKKLKKWFIDNKINLPDRNKSLLIVQQDQIFAIVGKLVSDLSKTSKSDIIESKIYIQKKRW